ncbi:hypothetical protein DEU56DRAFT_754133, partial [Suillus clintonianus]|uniref:uncharacterized protein n=1 Tax=Suillus clintonianus TaxID=1904413 RepID=UPI001B86FF62
AANPTLFASPEEVEKARTAIIAAKRDEPKVSLPDVVPGYKAKPPRHWPVRNQTERQALSLKATHKIHQAIGQTRRFRLTIEWSGGWLKAAHKIRLLTTLLVTGIIQPVHPPTTRRRELTPSSSFTAVPPKVDEAFKAFKYVPYSTLTSSARWQAIRSGEEAFTISASGSLMAKGLDRRNERSITLSDWIGAADAAEDRTEHYHGVARAKALKAHHSVVLGLSRSHSWDVAVEYDIQQREMVAQHPQHDLSQLDDRALTIIATCIVARQPTISAPYSQPQLKRPSPTSSSQFQQPPKKKARLQCFQCGGADHLPGDCTAESTVTGHPTARIASSAKSAHALAAPGGKIFCIGWARFSSCHFANACVNYHGCSICGDTAHGAGTCRATRPRS